MNKKELDFILQEGEGLKLEFKESLADIDKHIVALANAEGGRIFLGVGDDNKVKGVKVDNKLKSQVQDIANNCDPPVRITLEEFNRILIINAEEGKNKPYKCSLGFYIRQGPNSQKMKTEDIRRMIFAQGNAKFDEIVNESFDFKDFDDKALNDYLERANIKRNMDKKSILFSLGASDHKGMPNNTGILFFSKHPKKYLINAYVTCARYAGNEKVNVLDRADIESNIIVQVEESIKFIRRNTRTGYHIRGIEREDAPEYPIEALREAIINAVMHRDYFEKGACVQIDIFDDRIHISNVGSLIPPLNKDNLGKIAVRRNPLIADLFHRIRFVEKMGTGIQRIRDVCKKHGRVKFDIETNGYFIAIFRLTEPLSEPVTEPLSEPVTEPIDRIVQLISSRKRVNRKSIIKELGLSRATATRYLSKLKKIGLIQFIGPDKTGYYCLTEKPKNNLKNKKLRLE